MPNNCRMAFIKTKRNLTTCLCLYRGYYMAAWGYEFYLPVLKVSLTSERSERVGDTFSTTR